MTVLGLLWIVLLSIDMARDARDLFIEPSRERFSNPDGPVRDATIKKGSGGAPALTKTSDPMTKVAPAAGLPIHDRQNLT